MTSNSKIVIPDTPEQQKEHISIFEDRQAKTYKKIFLYNYEVELTELLVLSPFRISVSIPTVEEHLSSPAARQRTATH